MTSVELKLKRALRHHSYVKIPSTVTCWLSSLASHPSPPPRETPHSSIKSPKLSRKAVPRPCRKPLPEGCPSFDFTNDKTLVEDAEGRVIMLTEESHRLYQEFCNDIESRLGLAQNQSSRHYSVAVVSSSH